MMRSINPETYTIHHLVKGEDLNHHQTLFAGRGAEWVVEAGFIAVASLLPPPNIVCVKVHGMQFRKPVTPGSIVRFQSKVVFTGKSRVVTYIWADVEENLVVDSFITFVHVDDMGKPEPHHLVVEPLTDEDKRMQLEALALH